ncbi:outer membrane beta-barrel protein [Flavobacterium silvaticum]|uniref:PorT family protein n=1 Tax=Flavobacterium silvaticum TaxID=1852020 RepID=A0A972FMT1_9FLAO|nr:outer membrane beta-barrel protein [Flavobacterium silvaticum]NMH28593.1 PorT family protein [Flavobacterium silvaticum]
MNRLLFFALVCCCLSANAQKLSYGIVIGGNLYNDQSSNSGPNEVFFDSGNDKFITPVFGLYGEYQLVKHMGVKIEGIIHGQEFIKGFSNRDLDEKYKFTFVDINPSFKYDFGEYRSGFYLQLGPKVAFMTKAELEGNDVKNQFKAVHLGGVFGFGWRVLKYVDIQAKADAGLSPFYKDDHSSCKIFNLYLTLNVDVARIFASK